MHVGHCVRCFGHARPHGKHSIHPRLPSWGLGAVHAAIMPRWLLTLLLAGLLLGLYLLLAGQASATEFLAAVPAVLLAVGMAQALRTHADRQMQLQAPWRQVLLRPLASICSDSVRVGVALLHAIVRPAAHAGMVSRQAFRAGGDQPCEAGRRALVVVGGSLAPNGFVLEVLPDALSTHRLVPAQPQDDTEWPV